MGFEFKKDIVNLDIAGNHFEIENNEEFGSRCIAFSAKAEEMASKIKDSDNDLEAMKKVIDLCKTTINTLVNDEKASEKIFAGRKDNMMEHMDVVMYIFEEVDKHKQAKMDRIKNFSKKNSQMQNRQQRRHGKKNK